ncbi:transcription elongation factor 1 homolog [Drosophila eugracilis]|uniref:transcription elongation factor 1 homolog n=1 Tax=Drosophila eugracilis TaxID=29029 RepID=UPI0007E6045A|nr:transcription elongation factor 1 homolog [Drosophila eugracilis]
MGRRKSKRKGAPRQKNIVPLPILFDCPFCNHKQACEVKIDRIKNLGRVSCTVCQEMYQTSANYLTEPIDIYNDWIDACEKEN